MTSPSRQVGSGRIRPALVGFGLAALVLATTSGSASVVAATVSPKVALVGAESAESAEAAILATDVRFLRLAYGDLRTLPVGLVPPGAREVRFAPDRRRLAYIASAEGEPAGSHPRIWVVGIDGAGRRAVSAPDAWPTQPAWSPDGRMIVFVDGNELRLVDIPSGRTHRSFGARARQIWLPSFHPDGRTILYTRVAHRGQRLELWTVRVGGGSPRRLRSDAAFGAWSPDGSMIAFRSFGRAVEPGRIWPYRIGGLYLMDGRGRHAHSLLRAGGSMMAPLDWSPVRPLWSPDGTSIVFVTFPKPDAPIRVLEVRSHHVVHVGCGSGVSWFDDQTLLLERPAPCRTSSLRALDLGSLAGTE